MAQRVVNAFLHTQSRDKSDWDSLTTGAFIRPSGGTFPSTPMQRIFQREHIEENDHKASVETQTSIDDESDGRALKL